MVMTWKLRFGVLILLAWSTGAYDKVYRRTALKRTSLPGVGLIPNSTAHISQQIVTDEDLDDTASPTGDGSTRTSVLTGHHGEKQGDQRPNSARGRTGTIRNMIQGKRTTAETVTSLSSAPQENQPGKPVPPTRGLSASLSSINVLASFAGKNRVLVISAPRSNDGYFCLMMTLLRPDVHCEMAERHMQQIVMFHQEGEMGGKVRRVNSRGQVSEQPLEPALVPRLMNFLKLEEGKFDMVLLKKNLLVEERYPYPVRLEAMYEAIDQTHMRKLEKTRQRGFVQRCRAAGVESQLIESEGPVPRGTNTRENVTVQRQPTRKVMERPAQVPKQMTKDVTATITSTPARGNTTAERPSTKPSTTITKPTTSTTTKMTTTTRPTPITKPSTTTAKPTPRKRTITTTTTKPTPRSKPTTTTTTTTVKTNPVRKITTTSISLTTIAETSHWNLGPPTTGESPSVLSISRDRGIDQPTTKPTVRPITESHDLTGSVGGYKNQYEHTTDPKHNDTSATQLTHENEEDLGSDPTLKIEAKKKNVTSLNAEREKETDKTIKRNTAAKKRTKAANDGDRNVRGRKPGKKGAVFQEKYGGVKLAVKQPNVMRPLTSFFNAFERRRRLLVITAPSVENRMFTQQRDEYLEQVCEMAVRKISIIVIFGTWNNGSMKIDHFQLEQERPLRGVPHEDLTNQPLIKALRKELGMTFNDYYMVLMDFDMKVKQEYEVPIAMKAVFDYIDTFPSRIMEMEHQKEQGLTCKREDDSRSLENFLSRFRWRRRLFVISAPEEEEWAYQQQIHALTSQACNLGLRHMSMLKLVGKKVDDMGGVLELYPINGSATVEREDLSASLVKDIRNYFQISPEYFSMLLVGKDGNVKSWYPSPMWSMSIIYDLVDSMHLRRQEMAIQQSLGMRCPEDEYGHHSYHGSDQDGYQDRGYGY